MTNTTSDARTPDTGGIPAPGGNAAESGVVLRVGPAPALRRVLAGLALGAAVLSLLLLVLAGGIAVASASRAPAAEMALGGAGLSAVLGIGAGLLLIFTLVRVHRAELVEYRRTPASR